MWFLYLLVAVFTSIVLFLLVLNHRNKVHFESKGVSYQGDGAVRMVLNMIKGISVFDDIHTQYKNMKLVNKKLAGNNDFGMTTIFVADADVLKSMLVKDFDHFSDRREFQVSDNDYLFKKMLVALTGEKWKSLRSKLSPTFTTGKIKRLFPLFDQSAKKLVKYIEEQMTQDGEMDLNEGYSKFTMDIIATAVCGIDSHAFDQKELSLFEKMGMKLQLSFGVKEIINIMTMMLLPKLARFLGLSFFAKDVQDFFSVAIKDSIHHRQRNNEKRNDFVQLMLEARDNKLKTEENELDAFEKDAMLKDTPSKNENGAPSVNDDLLDDDGIVANCVLFLLAGHETTQSLLIFCAYALALNQDIQDRLRSEVDSVLDENDGEFRYDSLTKMTYLDMIINETLRYYPPAPLTDRGCTRDYEVPGTDYVLKKGQGILIPIMEIHHDEDYYAEPEKFDPERFSPENKGKINPYTFLAFGGGPRSCIGNRFALAEVKIAIGHLVHNFRIEPSQKTLIPMKFSNANSLRPEGGMFLALNKIQH